MTAESDWSENDITINIKLLAALDGLMANFASPRLIQDLFEDTFSLSLEISVQWEAFNPADDVTGYEVYMDYEELRPYDMLPSDSAMDRRCAPGTVVREQVVEQQMMGRSY